MEWPWFGFGEMISFEFGYPKPARWIKRVVIVIHVGYS